MNRRAFFGGLFAILPAATCYKRVWKEITGTDLPVEATAIMPDHDQLIVIWTVDGREDGRSIVVIPKKKMPWLDGENVYEQEVLTSQIEINLSEPSDIPEQMANLKNIMEPCGIPVFNSGPLRIEAWLKAHPHYKVS